MGPLSAPLAPSRELGADADLAACDARVAALIAALGLEPGRLEVFAPADAAPAPVESALPRVRLVGPARLRWTAIDGLGRAVVVSEWRADDRHLADDRHPASAASSPYAFHLVHDPAALLEALLTQGTWPAWLAPEPLRLLPVPGDADLAPAAAARALQQELQAEGLAAGLDPDGSLSQRVGRAHAARVPWLVVLGRRELRDDALTLRGPSGERTLSRAAAIATLRDAAAPPACLTHPRTGDGRRAAPQRPTGGNCHSAP
ncbi:MAG: His/Gly/Thr/Pro-type tRNA ligase C-terminal domain-containing protein [Planctomycetota bacterium]